MNKSFIWKFLLLIGVLSLTLIWARLSLAAAIGELNITSGGNEKPARAANLWNNNIFNFFVDGKEFYIHVVNLCNNSASCTCDNIQETTVPGEGKKGQTIQTRICEAKIGAIRSLVISALKEAALMGRI